MGSLVIKQKVNIVKQLSFDNKCTLECLTFKKSDLKKMSRIKRTLGRFNNVHSHQARKHNYLL